MNPYTPPTKPSEPLTQTARRIRARRKREQADKLAATILMIVVCFGIAAGSLIGILR